MIKLIAFDLDGTLTCHKTPLCEENRQALEALGKKYKLLMVGAGNCRRIFEQMGRFPIDIIGNYGMQYAEYDPAKGDLETKEDHVLPCDKEACEKRVKIRLHGICGRQRRISCLRMYYLCHTRYKGKNRGQACL